MMWGITGRKHMGKTLLVERLVREMRGRGLTVSTLKRTHHALDLETEGSDSHRHRLAGAGQVMLVSDRRLTLMEEAEAPTLLHAVTRLAPVDVVLAEGWKDGAHRKLEVWRPGGDAPLATEGRGIDGLAAPRGTAPDVPCPVLDLDDAEAVADWMLAWTST